LSGRHNIQLAPDVCVEVTARLFGRASQQKNLYIKEKYSPCSAELISTVEQYFSLTANQPQPAYKPKKQPAEQGHYIVLAKYF
jgi:hypothetical protein